MHACQLFEMRCWHPTGTKQGTYASDLMRVSVLNGMRFHPVSAIDAETLMTFSAHDCSGVLGNALVAESALKRVPLAGRASARSSSSR